MAAQAARAVKGRAVKGSTAARSLGPKRFGGRRGLGTPFILFHCSVIKTKPLAVMGPPFGASSAAVGAFLAFTAHVCPCPAPGQHRKPH